MQPLGLIVSVSVVSLLFVTAGVLLAYSPALFVRIYRRVAIGDYYAKSPDWAQKIEQPSSRILGVLFVVSGLFGIYKLLELLHII